MDVLHSLVSRESGNQLDDPDGHVEKQEQLPEGPLDWKIDDSGEGRKTCSPALPIIVADLVVVEDEGDDDGRNRTEHGR